MFSSFGLWFPPIILYNVFLDIPEILSKLQNPNDFKHCFNVFFKKYGSPVFKYSFNSSSKHILANSLSFLKLSIVQSSSETKLLFFINSFTLFLLIIYKLDLNLHINYNV